MKLIFKLLVLSFGLLVCISCNDSRIVQPPIEQTRPAFVQLLTPVDSSFAYDKSLPITMVFDEPMDVETFPGNFHLWKDEAKTSEVLGVFSSDGNNVIFTPDSELEDAHQYYTELTARVRDINGNGIDKDTLFVSGSEFFTSGRYSKLRSPEYFVTTGSEDMLLKTYINSGLLTSDTVASIDGFGRQLEIASTFDGSKLIMSDYNSANSGIYIVNPETYQIEKKLTENPTSNTVVKKSAEIVVSKEKAYVVNQSSKVISVVDLLSETITEDIAVPGTPKGLAISPDYLKLYVGSALDNNVWVINRTTCTLENTITLDSLNQVIRLAVSADGKYLIVRDLKESKLLFIDVQTETLVNVMRLSYEAKSGNNNDLAVYGNYVFVSSESGVLSKIDVASQTIVAELVHTNIQGIDIYPDGELMVATLREIPAKLAFIIPETMKIIRIVELGEIAPWDVAIRQNQ
ncbi:MAG: Ig-like domain-containing protein [Bacteroidetes bacterium]|nr:Ig-like domain-containing protein [Bacteroidota bacterium]MBU1117061.1 Ig-like domain-containing protein [Bacteroidota bacterium]MBU1797656.1 Ig-like domain-containing protein [Bacteroidota bacterium]